jgi:hypothetical protein
MTVMRGRSASKTRVNALVTRASITFATTACLFREKKDGRVKPGNDGRREYRQRRSDPRARGRESDRDRLLEMIERDDAGKRDDGGCNARNEKDTHGSTPPPS